MFTRYAIYYTPAPDSALARFGACWLGWDSAQGCETPHLDGLATDLASVTATPRKYGFHGTIKPPMRLAPEKSADDLAADLDDFARRHAPVTLDGLRLARLGKFLALVPNEPDAGLADLAGRTVQAFDAYRAPPSDAELAKRRRSGLSAPQEANLAKWGYPYVFEEFRFHLTLTGPLSPDALVQAQSDAQKALSTIELAPWTIDALTLLGEAEDGRFRQIHRYALTG